MNLERAAAPRHRHPGLQRGRQHSADAAVDSARGKDAAARAASATTVKTTTRCRRSTTIARRWAAGDFIGTQPRARCPWRCADRLRAQHGAVCDRGCRRTTTTMPAFIDAMVAAAARPAATSSAPAASSPVAAWPAAPGSRRYWCAPAISRSLPPRPSADAGRQQRFPSVLAASDGRHRDRDRTAASVTASSCLVKCHRLGWRIGESPGAVVRARPRHQPLPGHQVAAEPICAGTSTRSPPPTSDGRPAPCV